MKITRDHAYAHSTASVYALFTDADDIEAKQEALGAREIQILDCERDGDGAVVRFVRELPADVPGILSRFLQPWNTIEQSEQWRDSGDEIFSADIEIDVANVPVTISGTLELKPVDSGCVNQIRLNVHSGIPFVGKTLAEFVAADCKRLIAMEYEYLTACLDGQ